jgi:hypothetical protein
MLAMRFPDLFVSAPVRVRVATALAVSALIHLAVLVELHSIGRSGIPMVIPDNVLNVQLTTAISPVQAVPDLATSTLSVHPPTPVALQEPAAISVKPTAIPPGPTAGRPAPASEIAPASGDPYYLTSELDQRPAPLSAIVPEYPDNWRLGPSDVYVVLLRVFINDAGMVDNAFVQAKTMRAFEYSAQKAFAKAQFLPGQLRGRSVRSQMLIEVRFTAGGITAQNGEVAAVSADRIN